MIIDAKGGSSTVTISNVNQSNGVIHVVDTVLMPRRNTTRVLIPVPNGMRSSEPGQPGSLFCDRDRPACIDLIARIGSNGNPVPGV